MLASKDPCRITSNNIKYVPVCNVPLCCISFDSKIVVRGRVFEGVASGY